MSFESHRLATDCCATSAAETTGGEENASPQGGVSDGTQKPSITQEAPESLLQLARDFCNGRTEAVGDLVDRIRQYIHPECIRRVTNLACEPEDLSQEVFVKISGMFSNGETWGRFATDADAKRWLIAVTRHVAVDQSRRQKRRPEVELVEDVEALSTYEGQSFRSTEPHFARSNEAECAPELDLLAAECQAALKELPERQQVCLSMKCDGFSCREIARELHRLGLTKKCVAPGSINSYVKTGSTTIRRKVKPPPSGRATRRSRNRRTRNS